MKHVLILALALCAPLMAHADCATNWMDCTADSPIQIGSFTARATEVIGSITAYRLAAVQQLQSHEISAAQARIVQKKADGARALWQLARTVCHADSAGNCPANSKKAFELLANAQKVIR